LSRSSKVDRRRFLRYVGAGAIAVGAAGAGYYLHDTGLGRKAEVTIPTATVNPTTSKFNHPPLADFSYKPHHLDPTDQQTVYFTNQSTDLDGDPLKYRWLVDNQPASTEKDYSAKLPVDQHEVDLEVSDPFSKSVAVENVTVEPDEIYPTKPLEIKHKGMRIFVGWKGMKSIPKDVTDEKLDIVRNELGCNAVYIYGNTEFEDDLIAAGKNAIGKGFDRIYIQPMYLDLPIDDTVEKIGEFAKKVKVLREMSAAIVFTVGHEFTYDSYGLVPGETYPERLLYPLDHPDFMEKAYAMLPDVFRRIIALCKDNYGYQITYDATIEEGDRIVPWSDPIFESVGTSAYIWDRAGWTESWIAERLARLRRFGKPVNFSEWGCLTYRGAAAEFIGVNMASSPYDEDEQANYIMRYCSMLNKLNSYDRNNVNGAFYNQLDDERFKGYGLYKATEPPNFGPGSSRKKGFYMYKSYQRAS
jgi:hypothetical protein